jgi:exopolysaccharide biosynthesis protein
VIAPPLPAALAPPAPFPLIVAQTMTQEPVAPGVRRATYRLMTSGGPLVVKVIAVDPREPTVRLDAVLASDRLISAGETLSSMARRTGAVAGVNGDYFDIGGTNQPLGIVVRAGELVRTPSKRVALDVRRNETIHFESFSFAGSVRFGAANLPLTAVNEWPPQGGASFVTPAYGTLQDAPGVTLATLAPLEVASPAPSGTYRVTAVGDARATTVRGPMLGFGPAAQALAPPPLVGDTVAIDASTQPPLDDVVTAVGGGPLLVANGVPVDDSNAPAPEERNRRLPVSGAACAQNGELYLLVVDGRAPAQSIGVTRPEFGALLLGFGASDGMAFDSGGSAELVGRVLGEAAASVLNAPSDGAERSVADGLFVYSDAPSGPPQMLVVRPSPIVALPGTDVPVHLSIVDASGHALGETHLAHGDVLHVGAASGEVVVRASNLSASVPLTAIARLPKLVIDPDRPNPDPGGTVAMHAQGFDQNGTPVELGEAVRWSADRGSFVRGGLYRASARDAVVTANAGGASAKVTVRVGRHDVALPYFAPELRLTYDFTSGKRLAYAQGSFPLPGEPLSFSVEIDGDGSGVGVRAAFVNRFGERRALTLAKRVDWEGWQVRTITLPPDLNPPVVLVSLYAVDGLGGAPARGSGALVFRRPSVVLAGTS